MKTILTLTLFLTTTAFAQDIKALSEKEVSDYLAGAGMGFGRTGELNGYPGPKHVLELAEQLSVTPEQKAKLEASMKTMRDAAAALGSKIVAKERELDHLFASGSIDRASLASITAEIGRLQGELRAVHLMAHLETKNILTREQVHRYMAARGHAGHH
jgi:Spy/CpxP family protein refolding chaperone